MFINHLKTEAYGVKKSVVTKRGPVLLYFISWAACFQIVVANQLSENWH